MAGQTLRHCQWPRGGSEIIENARVYDNLADAAFDVSLMVAASARRRDLPIKSADPRAAAMMMLAHERQSMASPADAASSGRVAMLFGPEASGLDNDEVVLADILVTAPLNPSYPSLNSGAGGFVDGMGMANGCLSCKPARRYCSFRSIRFRINWQNQSCRMRPPPRSKSVIFSFSDLRPRLMMAAFSPHPI